MLAWGSVGGGIEGRAQNIAPLQVGGIVAIDAIVTIDYIEAIVTIEAIEAIEAIDYIEAVGFWGCGHWGRIWGWRCGGRMAVTVFSRVAIFAFMDSCSFDWVCSFGFVGGWRVVFSSVRV